jgi:hypothetical protein
LCIGQSAVASCSPPMFEGAPRPATVCVASHIANAAALDHIVNVAIRANEVRVRIMDEPPCGSTTPPQSTTQLLR